MEPISFSFDYQLADYRALQLAARRRVGHLGTRRQRLIARLPAAIFLLLLFAGLFLARDQRVVITGAVCVVGVLLFVIAQSLLVARRYRPRPAGAFLGPVCITLDPQGIRVVRPGFELVVHWSRVRAVDATATHAFAWMDAAQGYALPARALPAPLTAYDLAERMRAFMAAAGATPDPAFEADEVRSAPFAADSETAAPGAARPSVRREIMAIVRLLLGRPVDGANLAGRDLSILVLSFLLLVLWIPLDPLVFREQLEFNAYAVSSIAWVAAGVLGLAWILSRLSHPRVAYRRTLLLVTGAMPIAIVASTLDALLDGRGEYLLLGATVLWSLLYFMRGLRAVSGEQQARAFLAGLVATFCFVIAGDYLYVNPSFWQYAEDDEQAADESPPADARTWARMEELQFGQQAMLDEQLTRIAALPRVKSAMYFVGFAGYGEQRVFAEEIALAQQRVAARYGSAQRSIALVNDRRDPEKLPLASAPALRYTLESLGSMMGPDDVLFLALSSHGSEDGSISISNEGRAPVDLDATELADMLRDAKIPWKVIVVSACYAGGFIDALRDEHTIVLAAAAQDRTSFGCADDRDLTYFGEAFYRDALPGAASLPAAFDAARAAIARRERAEQVQPSEPQAFYGAAIQKKLAVMEAAGAPQ
jgi:Peptidase C13 family